MLQLPQKPARFPSEAVGLGPGSLARRTAKAGGVRFSRGARLEAAGADPCLLWSGLRSAFCQFSALASVPLEAHRGSKKIGNLRGCASACPGAVAGALGLSAGNLCRAGGGNPCKSISERCLLWGGQPRSLSPWPDGGEGAGGKKPQQCRAQELGHRKFCPVGNTLASASRKWSSEMKAKEGSRWEGWRMELRGMLQGCVYVLGGDDSGSALSPVNKKQSKV